MAKKIVWQWEQIDEDTSRVKVLGGWWVIAKLGNKNTPITSIFIPDQHWEWQPIEPYIDPAIEKAKLAKNFEPIGD